MAIQTSTTQLAVLLGQAISETFDSSGESLKPVYPKYLKDIDEGHAKRITYQFSYFDDVPVKPEGQAFQYNQVNVGTPLTVEPITFGTGVRFTMEALEDMQQEAFGGSNNSRLVAATRLGQAFRDVCNQKLDVLATQIITSANSATATATWQGAGWDSKALAASDHPILSSTSILGGTTYSNLGAAASLSQSTLQTLLSTMETIPTWDGLVRPLGKKYKLVVGPALRHTAYTAIETAKKAKSTGTTDHDVPGLDDFDIEVIVNPFMGASSTAYALIGPNFRGGMWIRKKPVLDDEKDFETKGHRYSVVFRARATHEDAHDFIFSVGA
jgi:hypothetical protein